MKCGICGEPFPDVHDQAAYEKPICPKCLEIVKCGICGKLGTYGKASHEGWAPSWWFNDESEEILEPICPECSGRYFIDHDNGAIVRPDAIRYIQIIRGIGFNHD